MTRAQSLFICGLIYGVLIVPGLLHTQVMAQFGGPGGQPYPLFVPPNQEWQSQPQGQQPPQAPPQQYPQGQPQGQTWQYQQGQPQVQYPQQGQYQAQGQQQPQAPQQQYPQSQPQAQGRQQAQQQRQPYMTKDGLDLRPPYPMPRDPCMVVKLYMDKYEFLTKNAHDSYENQTNETKLKTLWAQPLAALPRDFKLALEEWEAAAIICLRFFRECDRLEWLRFDTVGLCDD